jgi:hypothetical protein
MNVSGSRGEDEAGSAAAAGVRPIFVFGCARSGTSLLSRILNRHPDIAVPFECHVFNLYAPLLRFYGDLGVRVNRERLVDDVLSSFYFRHWQPRPDPRAVLAAIRGDGLGNVFDAILTTWTRSVGKPRWGEKSPHHIEYWEQLHEIYPKAQVVHIVRDGRDVALSLLRARFGPKTVFAAAGYWRAYLLHVERMKQTTAARDVFELKYEDLVREPQQQVRDLCDFLGEPYSDELLRYYETGTPYPTDRDNLRNLQMPIMRDNAEKWKTRLSPSEIRIFEAVAGDMLERYGYERLAPEARLSRAHVAYLRWLQAPPRRLLAMLRNRRGYVEAWIMLRIRLRLALHYARAILASSD